MYMDNTSVGEVVLEQEVLKGTCVYSMSIVSTSITGRIVIVQYSSRHASDAVCETAIFRVVDGECEHLGSGTELIEQPFINE